MINNHYNSVKNLRQNMEWFARDYVNNPESVDVVDSVGGFLDILADIDSFGDDYEKKIEELEEELKEQIDL